MTSRKIGETASIAAIILAAGASSRFGSPKQLLEWQGENLVNTCIKLAGEASLKPIILVLGSNAACVQAKAKAVSVKICINDVWQEGQSTSLRAGLNVLEAIAPEVFGTLFLLVDQPQTPVALLEAIKARALTGADIVLPKIGKQLANPVFFSRRCFAALKAIRGDQGGRAIFEQFPVETIEWQDTGQTMDIDTPEDFARLRAFYGINGGHQV